MSDETEQWRAVADPIYAGAYRVSNLGNVFSVFSGRLLRPGKTSRGYMYVVLVADGSKWCVLVHRLVAFAWIGEPIGCRKQVNHLDGDKTNNAAANLEWCSQSENMRHAVKNGLSCGSKRVKFRNTAEANG